MRAPLSSPCRFSIVLPLVCLAMLVLATSAVANVPLTLVAVDPFTNPSSQHRTVVGPDSFSFGSTIVAAAQAGRFFDDGASGIVFATSTNNGASWTSGVLPGMTGFTSPAGPYDRVSDPSVAYNARYNVWLISSLALHVVSGQVKGQAILTSRSTNGGLTWSPPSVTALATSTQDFDKNWIVCDNTPTSPYYGYCYTEWVDLAAGNRLKVARSTIGGLPPWPLSSIPSIPTTRGVGGQPLVLPSGRVVVVFSDVTQSVLRSIVSLNGGATFTPPLTISTIAAADDPGTIRSDPLVSAEVSGGGTIYVVWADCRYRGPAVCPNAVTPNDLVYKTSPNGVTWTPPPSSSPVRIPIDPTTGGVDHFIPGVAVDKATSGSNTHVAVAYYFYPNVGCTFLTCQLDVGYVSSANGGSTWSAPTQLAGPMTLSWLPNTTQGRMVGDYISTSFDSSGLAHPVFPLANAPLAGGSDCPTATPNCDQALYTPTAGLAVGGPVPTPPLAPPLSGTLGANPRKR